MTDWYAPNQQCVSADGSGPAAPVPGPTSRRSDTPVSHAHPKEVEVDAAPKKKASDDK